MIEGTSGVALMKPVSEDYKKSVKNILLDIDGANLIDIVKIVAQ